MQIRFKRDSEWLTITIPSSRSFASCKSACQIWLWVTASNIAVISSASRYRGFAASGHTTFLHATPATRGADMVFRVNGDSMEPKYPDHCNVLVKFTDEPLGSGDIGIFQVDGALYIKQYQSDGLHSLNKHFKIMRRKSYDEIKTIGRVIGILPDSDFATSAEIQDFQTQESQN